MNSEFSMPRPEYPRPDRQRGTIEGFDWLNLNGPWQFRFDAGQRGMEERWFEPDDTEWREQIIVPFCWESLAAWRQADSAGNENYYSTRVFLNPLEVNSLNHRSAPRYEVGWYRRWVEIPDHPAWHDKRVILTVGAADFFTDCWCNGKPMGHHEGGYTPFEFDITDALMPLEQGRRGGLIVFRVEDPMQNSEQPVGKQWRWYTPTSGIWQTVFVEPRSHSFIESFRITPDLDSGTAHFAVSCFSGDSCSGLIRIKAPDGTLLPETEFGPRAGMAGVTVPISPLLLWDPNAPHLYEVELSLRSGGSITDVVRTHFGMRKFDFTPSSGPEEITHLHFNGAPRYLRGALYQAYFPEGVYTPGSVERFKEDIQCAKRFGFNFLRVHIKVEDPLFLHYADTMGILLMADFPNFGESGNTPLGRRRFEQLMRETIKRDFNHPSIIAWCMFNETWGFGGQVKFVDMIHPTRPSVQTEEFDPRHTATASAAVASEALKEAETAAEHTRLANLDAHEWVQKMWELAKHLDPTRLVEDMSVCHWEHLDYYAHGDTDINSWHFYINDYSRAREHIEHVVTSTYAGSSFNYVPGFRHRGQPLINSEYGGVGALDGDCDVSWSFKFLTNELRRHDKISAYIYTELHDVEWEYNGVLNYDRTAKDFGYDPGLINAANVLILDGPPVSEVSPGSRIYLPVFSSHYSVQHHENVTLMWRLTALDTFGRQRLLHRGWTPIAFPHRQVAAAHTIEIQMPNETALCALSVEAIAPDGTVLARNFVHYFACDGYPASREERPRLLALRQPPDGWQHAKWSGRFRTRERAREEDCCFALGTGHFEWTFPLERADLLRAKRLRVLCEASSRRMDCPQTDEDLFPTTAEIRVNNLAVHRLVLPNHPHDSRGVLSYLRGGRGAYGYLVTATAEGELLRRIVDADGSGTLRLSCGIPGDAVSQGGLSVYGARSGRYPICPTVVLEW